MRDLADYKRLKFGLQEMLRDYRTRPKRNLEYEACLGNSITLAKRMVAQIEAKVLQNLSEN